MPLSAPAPRELYHTRKIECKGYAREDGLWDIEAHMTDVKSYAFANQWRGEVKPGTPIHDMWLRLTFNDRYTVMDVEAVIDGSPFEICPAITPNFKKLIGLTVGPGWKRKVRELVGGTLGCTHLGELLSPVATVAFQTISAGWERRDKISNPEKGAEGFPGVLNTCHAWASDSPVVKEFLPNHYVEKKIKVLS